MGKVVFAVLLLLLTINEFHVGILFRLNRDRKQTSGIATARSRATFLDDARGPPSRQAIDKAAQNEFWRIADLQFARFPDFDAPRTATLADNWRYGRLICAISSTALTIALEHVGWR